MTHFAADEAAFNELKEQVHGTLHIGRRLPEWPFRAPAGYVTVYEYDRVLGLDFGSVLDALARGHDDDSVVVLGLEPTPAYYRDEYGFLPGLQFDRGVIVEGFAAGLSHEPDDDPTGRLGDTLDVVAIAGSSGAWGIWGQRDWEIGLLLTPEERGAWLETGVPWFDRDVDLDSIRSPAGWGTTLSAADREEFARQLRERGGGP
ncbi:hypothetical protein [Haloactinopolyspora alba]|uniref:hypothetical protein n=1 Tax=Haloactinopolyspora alba TaxID=648780 RepID=UPI000D0D4096|nr:hypothetical protein [Haloactinopolyspora alba]